MMVIVDLDRTLIPFDTTLHALKLVLLNQPKIDVFKNFMRGKKQFKNYLLNHVDWNIIEYPINLAVVNYINVMKKDGHAIYLLSGSNQKIVDAISRRLNIFDKSIGSSQDYPKMKFKNKLIYIKQELGASNWIYIADAYRDAVVWKEANTSILVTNSRLKYYLISKLRVKDLRLIKIDSPEISLPNSEF